jgi:hypothetical protein
MRPSTASEAQALDLTLHGLIWNCKHGGLETSSASQSSPGDQLSAELAQYRKQESNCSAFVPHCAAAGREGSTRQGAAARGPRLYGADSSTAICC